MKREEALEVIAKLRKQKSEMSHTLMPLVKIKSDGRVEDIQNTLSQLSIQIRFLEEFLQ